MSLSKKFRIQHGVDITGTVRVGDQLVINPDGTIAPSAIDGFVSESISNGISGLQLQVDAILGSSPESLDTFQEIVASFQTADNDLQTLIKNNSASVKSLSSSVGSGSLDTDADTIVGAINELNAAVQNIPAGPTGARGPKGPQGDSGQTGKQGQTGSRGPTGTQGPVSHEMMTAIMDLQCQVEELKYALQNSGIKS